MQNGFGCPGIGNFETVILIQRDDQLESVNGIQAKAAGPEERLLIGYFFGWYLEHAILHQHLFDFAPESGRIMHS